MYDDVGRKGKAAKKEEEAKRRHVLVVCPAVVLHNWRNEFMTWGHFKVRSRSEAGAHDTSRGAHDEVRCA